MTIQPSFNRPFKSRMYIHNANTPTTGVLLLNLGTPDGTSYFELRRYLKQFLSDRRVIELNPLLWQPLLRGLLLQIIPFKSARNYRKIWDTEHNDSPLRVIGYKQAAALQKELGTNYHVELGMRYGNPSIDAALEKIMDAGCTQLKVIPLYPQYAGATTGSASDGLFDALKKWRWMPALQIANAYHDHPAYIKAIADSLKPHIKKDTTLVLSYHGLPEKYFKAGDPYPCHCWKTTRLVREALGLEKEQVRTSFQSQFGKDQWLEPSTEHTLQTLPQEGHKNVVIATPGFFTDCIETLEEIDQEGRETFIEAGGENFTYVPCINDSPAAIKLLKELTAR